MLAIYEPDACTTGSYERLVRFLIDASKLDEAERWRREFNERIRERLPGTAASLANLLCELARRR